MKKLMKNKKGFTLMEMLIVVAIIVILVAISIPVFTSQLDGAKTATDEANMRAAKGAAVTLQLTDGLEASKTYYYDADNGKIGVDIPKEVYGQSHKDAYILVIVDENGEITYKWSDEK